MDCKPHHIIIMQQKPKKKSKEQKMKETFIINKGKSKTS